MSKLAPFALLLFAGSCLMGCKAVTSNAGEWSIAFSQGVVIKTSAAKTSDEQSEAGLWPTPLTDYVFKDSDGDGTADTSAPAGGGGP